MNNVYNTGQINVMFKKTEEIRQDCMEWAKEISKDYDPDLVIFVAKSGFLFAEPLTKYFNCSMVDVFASRIDNGKKDIIKKIIPLMPSFLLAFLLKKKVTQKDYSKKNERVIKSTERLDRINLNMYSRILLVDDSVDTGWSMIQVIDFLKKRGVSKLKIASYCVLGESRNRIKIDYCRYFDTIVITATSRYSKEYRTFLNSYENWQKSGWKCVDEKNSKEII